MLNHHLFYQYGPFSFGPMSSFRVRNDIGPGPGPGPDPGSGPGPGPGSGPGSGQGPIVGPNYIGKDYYTSFDDYYADYDAYYDDYRQVTSHHNHSLTDPCLRYPVNSPTSRRSTQVC